MDQPRGWLVVGVAYEIPDGIGCLSAGDIDSPEVSTEGGDWPTGGGKRAHGEESERGGTEVVGEEFVSGELDESGGGREESIVTGDGVERWVVVYCVVE